MDGIQPTIYPPSQMDPLDPYTESQGVETQPEWDVGPIKSHEGYVGSNRHFGVRCNVIKIKNSDAVADNRPSEELRQLREFTVNNERRFSQYELQKAGDSAYQVWMQKIGPYLADWALGLPRNGDPPWRLMKFPDNYTLWVHKSGVVTDRGNPRFDAYLFGAPHLGPRTSRTQSSYTIFRSPTEFVPHAIWLMRGRTGQCDCKYCLPGQHQHDINRRLNHGVDVPESDDDGNPPRRRSGAGRTRRVRRDRTPPINIEIARDYRVRVTDPGPSSAT